MFHNHISAREKERKVLGMREDLGERILSYKIRESGRGIRESGCGGLRWCKVESCLTKIQSMACSNLVSQTKSNQNQINPIKIDLNQIKNLI